MALSISVEAVSGDWDKDVAADRNNGCSFLCGMVSTLTSGCNPTSIDTIMAFERADGGKNFRFGALIRKEDTLDRNCNNMLMARKKSTLQFMINDSSSNNDTMAV